MVFLVVKQHKVPSFSSLFTLCNSSECFKYQVAIVDGRLITLRALVLTRRSST